MNQFGNRGFGGPPQPQRQGGRRGMNRGGFRGNSRFEHNRPPHYNQGQRPNNDLNKPQQNNVQPQQQQKPQQPQQQTTPQPKPAQPQQQPKASPVQPPKTQQSPVPPQAQQKKDTPPVQQAQQNVQKPSQDNVDKATPDKPPQGNPPNQQQHQQQQQQQQQQRIINGNAGGGNRQGGWQSGRQGPGQVQGQGQGQGHGQGHGQGQGFKGPKFGAPNASGPQGQARNQQRGPRGPGGPDGGKPPMREDMMLANKLKDLQGPILDVPPIDQSEVKFNGRSRLYIGNLTNDVSEEEILGMFKSFGETAELFLNKEKNFGFIKLDYRANAERAKHELDGKMRNGKTLRVRFAPHNSAVHVKNLPPFVSNELLYRAFEIFGKIERAYVRVDERGKPLGDAVVEFARKPSAMAAIRNCNEKCFFLTSSLRPVIVESFEEPDEVDGYPEKNLPRKHPEFLKAREFGPRFSELGSFEHEYGTRWKQLHELHKQKEEALKKELAAEEEKLEAQMEFAKYEHETELLRQQLRQREQDRERQKRSWEMAERAADERRETERAQLQRHEEELSNRMRQQDDELRRRQQENTLFVQAQRLSSMLDRQEQGMFEHQKPMEGGFRDQFDMPRGGYDDNRGGWDGPRQMDDYPNKRRRY